jgi:hypothetical protein
MLMILYGLQFPGLLAFDLDFSLRWKRVWLLLLITSPFHCVPLPLNFM